MQGVGSGEARFQDFDYGSRDNLAEYGTVAPPRFNLTAIQTPLAFFRGGSTHTLGTHVRA